MNSFAGKTAVVTGAAGGMGLNIARDLAAAGASVTGIESCPGPTVLPAGSKATSATKATLARAMLGHTNWSSRPGDTPVLDRVCLLTY